LVKRTKKKKNETVEKKIKIEKKFDTTLKNKKKTYDLKDKLRVDGEV
jgi:hypothetical protein